MNKSLFILLALLATSVAAEDKLTFNRDIRPILSDKCFACHGPNADSREAELRLDVRASAIADRAGVRAIVAGDAKASELIQRVLADDEDERMPPAETGKHLEPSEIATIRKWIEQGAEYQQHWAFMAPSRPTPPDAGSASGMTNPIDRFIFANLEAHETKPTSKADPVTLVRRLYFDLTGLPPTPEQIDAFADDPSLSAYGAMVDSLLMSPHYGERMATYWLDLVRFADTQGYHSDDQQHIFPYRDYVISAFNSNMGFDRFTTEQLAGDLLENATLQQQIASGYNRLNQVTGEGGAQAGEYLVKYTADRIRTASEVWLGATLGCAECHDHKFDPFTARDFYQFGAFFADLDQVGVYSGRARSTGNYPPMLSLPQADQAVKMAAVNEKIATLKVERASPDIADNVDAQKALDKKIKAAENERNVLARSITKTMVSRSVKPRVIRILPRGNWLDSSGEVVEPGVPHFLPQPEVEEGRRLTRLDLAEWILDENNPLTARVFVNRLWYLYFGQGLSNVLNDLGSQGEWPRHPELLDWLAVEFRESGWDVKHVIRLLVTSRTYQLSSTPTVAQLDVDPLNRLHARQARFRLQAEFIRDNALAISGLLVRDPGGRSVKPYQPIGYWSDSYKSVGNPHRYVASKGDDLYRRGMYTFWKRTFLHPSLLAFDAPSREACEARRPISNTPLQALVLLNDPTYVEAARAFAIRAMTEGGGSPAQRITWIMRQAVGRRPHAEEIATLSELYADKLARYEANESDAVALAEVGAFRAPADIDVVELAAWTVVTRVVLNLHETITRN
jgi:mono/diheme cytochrome c family protein